MKKTILVLVLFFSTTLFSKEYMVQIEPFKSYEIKSQTSGVIKFVNDKLESKFIKMNEVLVQINSIDEKIELKKQKDSLNIQNQIIKIKQKNYQAKKRIKQLSLYDKNSERLSLLESKKELISTTQEIKKLQNEINKKIFKVDNRYINEIFINQGEYVNEGDKLFDMFDISNLKIVLYLSHKEIELLDKNSIYIDGKKSDFKTYKIRKIKDEIKVSRYKVEFIKKNEKLDDYFFNKIVKVEIK